MRPALIALPFLLALATSCGSGGEKRLSKEEYASRADAICRRTNRLTRSPGPVSSMPALARFAERSLPPLDRAIRDLRALRPPEEEAPKARLLLRQLTLLRGDVVRIRNRARANNARGVTAVVPAATRRNERFAQLAAELGMTVCSRG